MRKPARLLLCGVVAAMAFACSECCVPEASGGTKRGPEASATASAVGEWKEHWGTPGQTDVTYHDRYKVTRTTGSKLKVAIVSRKQRIWEERFVDGLLTFTQHTDTYVVKYSLKLRPDGKWLVGTATTPKKVVPVKWERLK